MMESNMVQHLHSIPAAYVKQAAEYVDGKLLSVQLLDSPNGYSTTAVKVFETKGCYRKWCI